LDLDYAKRHSSSANVLFNDGQSLSARLQYSLDFGNNNYIKPFSWLGMGPILRAFSRTRIYFTPRSANFNFSLNDNENRSQNRLEAQGRQTINTTTSRSINLNYRLTDNLNIDYSRTHRSDAFLKGYRAGDVLKAIFKRLDFGVDKNISQRFSANYNPKTFNWITHSFRYTADYNYNLNNPEIQDRSANLNVNRQLTVDFKPSLLVNTFYHPTRRPKIRRPRRPSRGRPGRHQGIHRDNEKESKEKTGEKEEEKDRDERKPSEASKAIRALNPLKLFYQFFNAWKSVRVDYSVQDNVSHFNLADIPGFKYQFGLTTNPGVGIDTSFNKVLVQPNLRKNRRLNLSSSFDFLRNLTTSFRYSYDLNRTENNQQSRQSISRGYFFTGDDPDASYKAWKALIPDWRFQLTGLEKIPFFARFAQSVSIEHARTGKFSEITKLRGQTRERDQWSYSNNYQPLLGINISTRWGITGTIRYIRSVNFNYNSTSGVRKAEQSGLNMNANLTLHPGFKIPFLKNKRLRNEVQLTLAFDKNSNLTFTRTPGAEKFEELDRQKSWKFRPSATYRFSERVNGSAFVEVGQSENKITGTFSWFEFGINVNIAIR
ncbi:MAG: hypothetical protein D6715_07985, partial [Calditrichaeota bacterium]